MLPKRNKLPSIPRRKKFASGGGVLGDVAAGAAVLGPIGAIGGFIAGLFGGGPKMPNIVDPVTGTQITDAAGRVVASQQQLQSYSTLLQGGAGPQAQNAAIQLLSQVSTGGGPNPAAAMLQEATSKNVQNQAALQAGQRGAASNVGMIARGAAQQGAQIQQQATGQAATEQSQQQLGAASEVGNLATQQEQAAISAGTGAGGIATQNQSSLLQAQTGYNTTIAGGQANVNTVGETQLQNVTAPFAAGAASGLGSSLVYNNAPKSPQLAEGGKVIEGPHNSHVANFLAMSKGGNVPALVSPGEIYLDPDHVEEVKHGANPLKLGHRIPGKAKIKGDSKKNDTVKATLKEGGVVLPRHIVRGRSSDKARLFVLKSIAKNRGSHGK